jgi:hypothetical protein
MPDIFVRLSKPRRAKTTRNRSVSDPDQVICLS